MDDDEIGLVREERFMSRRRGGVEDEFLERGGGEARGGEEDGFGFGEVDLAEKGVERRLEEFI